MCYQDIALDIEMLFGGSRRQMGTYIDAFIEVDYGGEGPAFADAGNIYSLVDGTFNLDRAYDVFDALAGGREALMAREDHDPTRVPLIAPRGLPRPCSSTVDEKYVADETHCATWLLLEEVDASLSHHGVTLEAQPACYRVVRSAVALLAQEHGTDRVRLVVWFSGRAAA